MITLKVKATTHVPVVYLRAECGVRYWEDATVNGVQDDDGSRIPCRQDTAADNNSLGGGTWMPLIKLETGKIVDWPQGTTADIHYKVCDAGLYELLDAEGNVVKQIYGYVPDIMCPEGEGYGDYVIMKVGPDGQINNWKVNLKEFEFDNDD